MYLFVPIKIILFSQWAFWDQLLGYIVRFKPRINKKFTLGLKDKMKLQGYTLAYTKKPTPALNNTNQDPINLKNAQKHKLQKAVSH